MSPKPAVPRDPVVTSAPRTTALQTRQPRTSLGKLLHDFIDSRTPYVERPDLVPALVDGELRLEEQRLRRSVVSKVFTLAYGTLALGLFDMIIRSVLPGYASPEWLPWLIGSGLIGAIVGFFTSTRFADWLFRRREDSPPVQGGA